MRISSLFSGTEQLYTNLGRLALSWEGISYHYLKAYLFVSTSMASFSTQFIFWYPASCPKKTYINPLSRQLLWPCHTWFMGLISGQISISESYRRQLGKINSSYSPPVRYINLAFTAQMLSCFNSLQPDGNNTEVLLKVPYLVLLSIRHER